jgi:hypothetical protein
MNALSKRRNCFRKDQAWSHSASIKNFPSERGTWDTAGDDSIKRFRQEWSDKCVPRPPFCPFAFLVIVGFIFIRSVSQRAPNRRSRFSVGSGDFLAMLLDESWHEASAVE